ncbi:MAG TPA: DUF6766 family protein [Pyrinomonadaceae bacterium]|nr:DUF6766 family protein [Pyrinomonadaceae bacterium]
MRRLHENGLSITLFAFFLIILVGQSLVGHQHYNEEQQEHGQPTSPYVEYITGSHFLEATMENWESEFLQMFFYVVFTVFLYQKGSAESKDPEKPDPVDQDPTKSKTKRDAPWPVRKGGLALTLYKHSLSLAFLLLFLVSFALHAVGGKEEYNQDQQEHGRNQPVSVIQYVGTSRFWFESLQNWQSEFLAVFAMVVLSIFLRQKGSAESKQVDAPHSETGKG